MQLEDLDLDCDDFEEAEEEALDALPLDEGGLQTLLNYLEAYDSYPAWKYLLTEFRDLLGDQYPEKAKEAERLFGQL